MPPLPLPREVGNWMEPYTSEVRQRRSRLAVYTLVLGRMQVRAERIGQTAWIGCSMICDNDSIIITI